MGRDSEGFYWIPIHVYIRLDEEKIVYSSVTVVSLAVSIRQYNCFLAVIKVSNMMKRGVPKYGL